MTIVFLSEEIKEHNPNFDPACLAAVTDRVIAFTPPISESMYATMVKEHEDLYIIVGRNPQMSGISGRANVAVELANRGMNPGNVGFVDLNHMFAACRNEKALVDQLQIHVGLSLVKLQHTRANPKVGTVPLKRILVVGKPSDPAFAQELTIGGLEVQGLWAGISPEVEGTPIRLGGMPGHYQVTLKEASGRERVLEVGAIVIFAQSLTKEQMKTVSTGFLMPIREGRLHLLPHQLRLSQGIKVIGAPASLQAVSAYINALLQQEIVPHYVEDPLIDHTKCGLCGTCVKTCMFHASAIEQIGDATFSKVYPEYCVACGNCVTACPTQARDLPSYSYAYFSSVWKGLQSFAGDENGLKILVIYCESNGQDAISYLAENRINVPSSCIFFKIRCGARVDTQFIPDSFRAGFDGVAVVVCSRDECGNIVGSLDLERRLNLYRKVMQATGIETGRMRILPVASSQLSVVGDSLQQFADFLVNLKQDKKLFSTVLS